MHKELIEQLRYTSSKGISVLGDLQTKAAGAIEALEEALEECRKSNSITSKAFDLLERERDEYQQAADKMAMEHKEERDTLRAELQNSITRRQEQMAASDFAVTSLKEENNTLRQKLSEAQRDAERYRFLFNGSTVYSNFRRTYGEWDGSDGKEGFDAAIDAAIAAMKGVV